MANALDKRALFTQNLIDAGCDSKTIERCISLAMEKATPELLRTLQQQRRGLLDQVHKEKKRIDCLDYLVYQIERGAMALN